MALNIFLVALVPLVLLAVLRLYRINKLSLRTTGYPPGPKTLPFLGNLHQIPISRPELKFENFARQFGNITGLKLGCQNMIILNTWETVRDLIEQKGAIYSSRPSMPIFEIVCPNGENPALSVYGDLWRSQRKKLMEFLGGDRTDKMKPVQDAESTQMIWDMLNHPTKLEKHIDRSFGATILATVFGQRGKTSEPGGIIDTFFKVEAQWAAAVGPTASPPINSFPILRKVPDWMTPWKGWKDRALGVRKAQEQMYTGLLKETRERIAQGKSENCFLAQCLKTQEKEWYNDKYLAYLGGVLLEGGAETSASSTIVFVMTMAAFPHVLKQAQEEVDHVCGTDRMPGKDDTSTLPYIRACMLEVLRWRPITPLAIMHTTTADDTYGAFKIPNNSDVMINTWKINHDPTFYDEPDTFDPSRYLKSEYGSKSDAMEKEASKGRRVNYTFGAGRRVCPGIRFAENTMMLHLAKLVWAFDWKALEKLPVDTWEGWSDGLVVRPHDLKVAWNLRDEGRREVIERSWVAADAFLSQFE